MFTVKAPSPAEMAASLNVQTRIAHEMIERDPRIPFIGALVIAGDRLSAERSDRWLAEGMPFDDALAFVGSYARLDWALRAQERGATSRGWLLDRLPHLWSGSDPDDTDPRFLALWREAFARNGHRPILDGRRLPPGDVLTVYRGQFRDAPLGIAWSLDRRVAEAFARSGGLRGAIQGGVVLTRSARRRDVLAYLTGRDESEVIVDPSLLLPYRRAR